jgi:hypothetical protein
LRLAKRDTRQEFFDSINTIEINKQLDPTFLGIDGDDWQLSQVEHELAERQAVSELICEGTFGFSDKAKMEYRLQTINALVALCYKRETPQRSKPDRTWGLSTGRRIPEQIPEQIHEQTLEGAFKPIIGQMVRIPEQLPIICSNDQCIFCFFNQDWSVNVQLHRFATKYKARDHVEKMRLWLYKDGKILCPDLECQGLILEGEMHFKSHAAQKHSYDIFGKFGNHYPIRFKNI